ncbi:MAG: SDR family oxidoreductase [Solirubrobacteraceae bacterium]
MILVIGSTGQVGSQVVHALRDADAPVRAFVRSEEKGAAARDAGAELAIGDLTDAASLDAALDGVDHVFLVAPAAFDQVALERAAIDSVARRGGIHLVKLSVIGADPSAPVRFASAHGKLEAALADSGVAHTILRPTDFMQNAFGWAATLPSGTIYTPIADAPISSVDVRDIAAVAAVALTEPGHAGKVYELTGPGALTRTQQAHKLADAAGRSVEVTEISEDQAAEAMRSAGYPDFNVDGLIELDVHVYAPGYAGGVADGVQAATGRPPRDYDAFAREAGPVIAGGG